MHISLKIALKQLLYNALAEIKGMASDTHPSIQNANKAPVLPAACQNATAAGML